MQWQELFGEDPLTVLTIVSNLKSPEGRFEYLISPSKITAIIDYAHTPDALENILQTLVSLKKGSEKIITVFGCGGDRDKGKRPLMGDISTIYSDHVLVTSDNPRSEDPKKLLKKSVREYLHQKLIKFPLLKIERSNKSRM